MWLNFCLSGQSIFISLIFLPFAFQKVTAERSFRKNTGLRGSMKSNYTVAIDSEDSENSIRKIIQHVQDSHSNESSVRTITKDSSTIDIKTGNSTSTDIQQNTITNNNIILSSE